MKDQDLRKVFLFKLETAAKQFRKYKNKIFKQEGIDITSDQWILLKNISEAEGISQIALAERCHKEAASVTRTLDILERKQWVERATNSESRRVYNLHTTEDGKELIEKILPIALRIRTQASLNMTEQEVETLNQLLDQIVENLE